MIRKSVKRRVFILGSVASLLGCGRPRPSVRLQDAALLTTDTLLLLLLGTPSDALVRPELVEPPLLKKGVYETVFVSAHASEFARLSRGTVSEKQILEVQDRVVEELNGRLKRRGFVAQSSLYPPSASSPRTLIVTLTPRTEETGSAQDRAEGRGKTMVLIRLTITDAVTGELLAQRDYYSGADAGSASRGGG